MRAGNISRTSRPIQGPRHDRVREGREDVGKKGSSGRGLAATATFMASMPRAGPDARAGDRVRLRRGEGRVLVKDNYFEPRSTEVLDGRQGRLEVAGREPPQHPLHEGPEGRVAQGREARPKGMEADPSSARASTATSASGPGMRGTVTSPEPEPSRVLAASLVAARQPERVLGDVVEDHLARHGAVRTSRTPHHMSVSPYSSAKPLPPCVWIAWSTQWIAASAAAYLAMLLASPAGAPAS